MKIGNKKIAIDKPTLFIADIAANHDGNINKAIDLIHSCAAAGADVAKFQHFSAETIVSDKGFKDLKKKKSHQSKWSKSVFQTYKDASLPFGWTKILKKECEKAKILFSTSPYSFELVDLVDKHISFYKIGSGDITWHEIIEKISKKKKPLILATGASSFKDVELAVKKIEKYKREYVLMQCNTNYTNQKLNFKHINLNVLKIYKKKFPKAILGLSDHTPGHANVLGAITLGARVIEKHYTLNNNLSGPDHAFSMNAQTWKEMIYNSRELEQSLGNEIKIVEKNETDTVILQRRSIRLIKNIKKNTKLKRTDLTCLRPCPKNAIQPYEIKSIIGKKLKIDLSKHDYLKWNQIKK
jgi:sialic acid synthase SpsE